MLQQNNNISKYKKILVFRCKKPSVLFGGHSIVQLILVSCDCIYGNLKTNYSIFKGVSKAGEFFSWLSPCEIFMNPSLVTIFPHILKKTSSVRCMFAALKMKYKHSLMLFLKSSSYYRVYFYSWLTSFLKCLTVISTMG